MHWVSLKVTSSHKRSWCKLTLKKNKVFPERVGAALIKTKCSIYSITWPHNHVCNSWNTMQSRHRLSSTFLKTATDGQFSRRAQPITDCTKMLRNSRNTEAGTKWIDFVDNLVTLILIKFQSFLYWFSPNLLSCIWASSTWASPNTGTDQPLICPEGQTRLHRMYKSTKSL